MTHQLTWLNRHHPPTINASSLQIARLVQTKTQGQVADRDEEVAFTTYSMVSEDELARVAANLQDCLPRSRTRRASLHGCEREGVRCKVPCGGCQRPICFHRGLGAREVGQPILPGQRVGLQRDCIPLRKRNSDGDGRAHPVGWLVG